MYNVSCQSVIVHDVGYHHSGIYAESAEKVYFERDKNLICTSWQSLIK